MKRGRLGFRFVTRVNWPSSQTSSAPALMQNEKVEVNKQATMQNKRYKQNDVNYVYK